MPVTTAALCVFMIGSSWLERTTDSERPPVPCLVTERLAVGRDAAPIESTDQDCIEASIGAGWPWAPLGGAINDVGSHSVRRFGYPALAGVARGHAQAVHEDRRRPRAAQRTALRAARVGADACIVVTNAEYTFKTIEEIRRHWAMRARPRCSCCSNRSDATPRRPSPPPVCSSNDKAVRSEPLVVLPRRSSDPG